MFKGVTEMVKKLFWINIIAFVAILILKLFGINIDIVMALYNYRGDDFHPYQLITHMIVHGGLLHIIFNMLALVSIAPSVESYYGKNKFLIFYILSGLGAAFLHMFFMNSNIPMVGASGSISGIVALFAILNPNAKLAVFPIPIGIKAKYLVSFFIGLEILLSIVGTNDHIAHLAHVGGALTGLALYFIDKNTRLFNKETWTMHLKK